MARRLKLMRTLAVAAIVAVTGCYRSHTRGGDAPIPQPDARVIPAIDGFIPPPSDTAFLITTLDLPMAEGGSVAGFDLDGIRSPAPPFSTCEEIGSDFQSPIDGSFGIDNAVEQLLPLIQGITGELRPRFERLISTGVLLIALAPVGPGSAPQELIALEPIGALIMTPDGRLAPDQRFRRRASLANPIEDRSTSTRAALLYDAFPIGIPQELLPFIPLRRMRNTWVGFDRSSSGLTRGVIGGRLLIPDILEDARNNVPALVSSVEGVVRGVADLEPSPANPSQCEALSITVTFEAVPVRLVE
jgi:hypothetical protein